MSEVQTSAQMGEMSQRFVGMLMRIAQQVAMCLGQIPNPRTNQPEKHLELGKMLIDELEMLREKTRNNLTSEEEQLLSGMLADFQLAYVRATTETSAAVSPGHDEEAAPQPAQQDAEKAQEESSDSKKRFTKVYE